MSDKRIPDNEGTAFPWWGIVDPRQIMRADDIYATAGAVTGVWVSREAAAAHLEGKRHRYGPHAVVFCFSGHASWDWRALCSETP